jgi:hypothetical protein
LTGYTNLASPDEQLLTDLQSCITATGIIEREQEIIRRAIDLETNVVKRDLLWWEHDFIRAYVERAAYVASVRLDYLDSLDTEEKRNAELELCERDVVHWFQYWAWGLDPRVTALPVVPFYPFKFQEAAIRKLDEWILIKRTNGVVDKSRDQGASWMAVDLSVHHWRFIPYFQCLFGSYIEDLIDSKEEPDTLLEKVRFQLRRLPSWMLPRGFSMREHGGYMKIVNPESGSLIGGAAPTINFGRAGRFSVIWFDELAAWRFGGYPQWTAASQSSRCHIAIFTPKGKANKAAELRFSGNVEVMSLHWKKHPLKNKDDRWYKGQALSMDAVEIAQELDIDYEASQPGRILPMFNEAFHVITWSEFKAVYGVDHIPVTWNLCRAQDVGTSDGHPNVTAWAARPRKNDKYNDTIFFYREFVAPLEWSIGQIAEGDWDTRTKQLLEPGIWQREKPLKENDRMSFSLLSWEAKSERRTYAIDCKRYPIQFTNIPKPDPNGGIAEMRNLMNLLAEPHPFVVDPRTGEHLFGRPRFILIVDDEQGKLFVDQDGETLLREGAIDEKGHARARFEIPQYHYPVTEKDKPVAKRVPFARDNDWLDDARYICRKWGPPSAEESKREKIEAALPEGLQTQNLPTPEEVAAMTEGQKQEFMALLMSRDREARKAEQKLEAKPARHWRRKAPRRGR